MSTQKRYVWITTTSILKKEQSSLSNPYLLTKQKSYQSHSVFEADTLNQLERYHLTLVNVNKVFSLDGPGLKRKQWLL